MAAFDFFQPTKIHFGANRFEELGKITASKGLKALLVTTENTGVLKNLFDRAKQLLQQSGVEVVHFDRVIPNPTTALMDEGIKMAFENKINVVIGLGGGSSIDTAKIIGLANGRECVDWSMLFSEFNTPFGNFPIPYGGKTPVIAVTTTSGTGSQVTQASVVTDPSTKEKNTIFHHLCFPNECIIDPMLMMSLPKSITASTGFDAFSHAFEAYINKRASLYTEMLSLNAITIISKYLPLVLENGENLEYRENMAFADTLAGIALANSGADAPHPLSEIICGVCPHVAHGQSLAMVYPGYTRYKYQFEVRKFANVARIFEPNLIAATDEVAAEAFPDILSAFLKKINMKFSLRDFNPTQQEMDEILSCPILEFLPMAPKDILKDIILSGY